MDKLNCLQPLMKLSDNYLELLLKLPGPEFKEAREELEKIYTRGQNLIYDAKDYKEMTKAFVSSAYELVMVYKSRILDITKSDEIEELHWDPAKMAYTSYKTENMNNPEITSNDLLSYDMEDIEFDDINSVSKSDVLQNLIKGDNNINKIEI